MTSEVIVKEIFEERAGIAEYEGLLTRDDAEKLGLLESERWRRDCEIRHVMNLPFAERRPFLNSVEKVRGKEAADKLRSDVQAEWFRKKTQ